MLDDDMEVITPDDLENQALDGGSWVIIHGYVYDIHRFLEKVSCRCVLTDCVD